MNGELSPGEPHPAAYAAKKWIEKQSADELMKWRETFSSCAIEGNQLGAVCAETLRRIMAAQPVGDRYLLGLAWVMRSCDWSDDMRPFMVPNVSDHRCSPEASATTKGNVELEYETGEHSVDRLVRLYDWLRIEEHHGKTIACGGIFPAEEIKAGQMWQESCGGVVTVESVNDHSVYYSWEEQGTKKMHDKAHFEFQCRYCLILPNASGEGAKYERTLHRFVGRRETIA